ncbi:hypothetical protein AJR17_010660 [Shigella boydii]|uniref:Uncharacterized protein n=1 Tax=Shigella boydii TaxID=621 RepID=A0A1S9JFS7_SHIBO|nr:RusA family crossover junction endodeoxyribonuclease [Shigella boydii]OOO81549.1 hypothetical protein AJR17_010660 [Shigella boydii]
MKLILPFPPSVNTYWRYPNKGAFAGKSLISAAGRKFQSAACAAIVEQLRRLPKPTSAPASVEIVLFPPDNRIRDLDNYNKALFDALTHAGGWEDDSQVKRMLVAWRHTAGRSDYVDRYGWLAHCLFWRWWWLETKNARDFALWCSDADFCIRS